MRNGRLDRCESKGTDQENSGSERRRRSIGLASCMESRPDEFICKGAAWCEIDHIPPVCSHGFLRLTFRVLRFYPRFDKFTHLPDTSTRVPLSMTFQSGVRMDRDSLSVLLVDDEGFFISLIAS